MSPRPRNDSASINFSVNVPPDVIREYFDGLAKVETAKHKPAVSTSSGFNWSSLVPLLGPIVIPLLTEHFKSSKPAPSVRVPESRYPRHSCDQTESDKQPDIVISFVQPPSDESDDSTDSSVNAKSEEFDTSKDNTKESESPTEVPKVESDKKPKRPAYEEGDNVMHLNLANLGAGLGGEGAGGLGEMMKMLGPMFQGLTSGLNGFGQAPVATEPSKPAEESVLELMASPSEECNVATDK